MKNIQRTTLAFTFACCCALGNGQAPGPKSTSKSSTNEEPVVTSSKTSTRARNIKFSAELWERMPYRTLLRIFARRAKYYKDYCSNRVNLDNRYVGFAITWEKWQEHFEKRSESSDRSSQSSLAAIFENYQTCTQTALKTENPIAKQIAFSLAQFYQELHFEMISGRKPTLNFPAEMSLITPLPGTETLFFPGMKGSPFAYTDSFTSAPEWAQAVSESLNASNFQESLLLSLTRDARKSMAHAREDIQIERGGGINPSIAPIIPALFLAIRSQAVREKMGIEDSYFLPTTSASTSSANYASSSIPNVPGSAMGTLALINRGGQIVSKKEGPSQSDLRWLNMMTANAASVASQVGTMNSIRDQNNRQYYRDMASTYSRWASSETTASKKAYYYEQASKYREFGE